MPRGTVLTREVERIIADVYRKRPELRVKTQKFYEEVYRQVHEKIDWAEPNWPGLSVVKKRLAALREKDRSRPPESTELDKAWSLCTLPKYPIPPEALPQVMSISEKCMVDLRFPLHYELWQLTVREALWIARLYKGVEFYYQKAMAKWADPSNTNLAAELIQTGHLPKNYREIGFEDILIDWAYVMAGGEELSEIEDEPFEEGEFDVHMGTNIFEYYGERRRDFVYDLEQWYGIDLNILDASSLSVADIEGVLLRALAKDREPHARILYLPKTEASKLRELLDVDNAIAFPADGMVVTPVKNGVHVDDLPSVSEYEIDFEDLEEAGTAEAFLFFMNKIIGKEREGKK